MLSKCNVEGSTSQDALEYVQNLHDQHWTTSQTLPSCGELLKQSTAKLQQVLRTRPSLSMAIKYLHLRTSPIDSTNSSPHQSCMGIHKSSRDTRKTVRATKRKSLIDAAQFCSQEGDQRMQQL